jgi:hypothetical protein
VFLPRTTTCMEMHSDCAPIPERYVAAHTVGVADVPEGNTYLYQSDWPLAGVQASDAPRPPRWWPLMGRAVPGS